MHICISRLTIIASDNGLSPGRCRAIIWNNAGILSIGLLGTNFSELLIEVHKFSFKKMLLKVSSEKWRPCCLGLNVLRLHNLTQITLLPPPCSDQYRVILGHDRYIVVSLKHSCLQNFQNRHPIACLWEWVMGRCCEFESLIYVLLLSSQCCM